MKHVDLTRPVKSMFGLDPMNVLAMSDDENSEDGDDGGGDYIAPEPRERESVEVEILGERIDPTLREIPTLTDKRYELDGYSIVHSIYTIRTVLCS